MAGRPPKPTKSLKLAGTYREDRHGGTVDSPPGLPVAPKWLTKDEQWAFDWLGTQLVAMGLESKADLLLMIGFSETWAEFVAARKYVHEHGRIAESHSGSIYQHPMVGIKNKAHDRMLKLASRFGLSPSDRASIHAVRDTDEGDALENRLLG